MLEKVLIVGGVAGGAGAAARLRRLNENLEIIVFEKGPHVSFSNCSLPFYLSDEVENEEDLLLMTPEKFDSQYNIETRVNQEVISINKEEKKIEIKNLITEEIYIEEYDKLILSPGAAPIYPDFPGSENMDIFTIKDVKDISALDFFIKTKKAKHITVIGGGFIGLEIVENLKLSGIDVALVEALDQVMDIFDEDMAQILHKELLDQNIDLRLGEKLKAFEKNKVILESGKSIETDGVVLSIGIQPESNLAKNAGLKLGGKDYIWVDENYQTSDPNIYAIGDAIKVKHKITGKIFPISLAGPAQRQARMLADHIMGRKTRPLSIVGSAVIRLFDTNAAITGLNEKEIKEVGFNYDTALVIPYDKVKIMPNNEVFIFKLHFEKGSGKILGAQAMGKAPVEKRIDTMAALIQMDGDIYDMIDLELPYAPTFSTARDGINTAGMVAENLETGLYEQILAEEVRPLVESGAYFLDIRRQDEWDKGHIKGAHHLPWENLRDHIDQIPKDETVYLYCRTATRSYNAVLMLKALGFNNVINVSGSMVHISNYEYAKDKLLNREPILTNYTFK